MSEAEIVDLGADPVEQRRASRRRLRRVFAPVGAATLLILSVIGLLIAGYENNRRGALALSENVLLSLERRIALRAESWLAPASRALRLLSDLYADGPLSGVTREHAERLAVSLIRTVPSIALVSLADTRGNYVYQRRNEQGGIDTKTINADPGPRRVTLVQRDAQGNVISETEDPADTFDPRTRPWYIAAVEGTGVVWTEPYVFFTDRVPGVTAAVAFRDGDRVRGVFGADIRLDELSAFLNRLEVGETGRAIIVDSTGQIVAHPELGLALKEVDGALVRARIDDLGDPVLSRAYSLHRINGHGRFTFALDGTDHIAIWAPLRAAGDGTWSILITVPEGEFTSFVAKASRLTGAVGAVVVLVALGLAGLLIQQGLRADTMERMLERRSQSMAAQARVLARLGRAPSVYDPARDEGLELLGAALAETLEAKRASIWRIGSAGDSLRCEEMYDVVSSRHVRGQRLKQAEHARLFAALARGEVFEVENASADPRTAELATSLLGDIGSRGVLCVPAMRGTALIGAILVEDRDRSQVPASQAIAFSLAIAGIATGRLAAAEQARRRAVSFGTAAARQVAYGSSGATRLPPPPASIDAGAGVLAVETVPPAPAEAAERPTDSATERLAERGLAAEVFPTVTVMELLLADPLALAEPVAEAGGCPLADQVVRIVQQAAHESGIAYQRVVGSSMILADGFGDRAAEAPGVIAALALDIAERCSELFASLDLPLGFRIGIATGPVIGSGVGQGVRTYNIWGEAVRAAEALAASAPRGTVQVSESVQARLGEHFALRPRGRYWVGGAGEVATFLLAGKA
ncbi:cache domain-containing protein [Elioraea rosea]|uniref:cache domain-containing protein n=1 Tax=Elioraea rosea TaxID=2492390 RepID=UPI001185E540|nr:cache domain-containing protein [Elioraea rosea]